MSHTCQSEMTSFCSTLLKIAITHVLSKPRVRTLTINSGDVPTVGHVQECTYPYRHQPINQTLSRHDVNWQQLTIYSDNLCRVWL